MKKAYDGEMNITWKTFPLEQVNSKEGPDWKLWEQPESYPSRGLLALKAGEAARKQGPEAFDRFHMALLNARHVDKKKIDDRGMLAEVAKSVGLDVDRFTNDLDDPASIKKIAAEYTEAHDKYGVFGVPTYLVGDELWFGREHLPRVAWLLGGAEGTAPDVANRSFVQ